MGEYSLKTRNKKKAVAAVLIILVVLAVAAVIPYFSYKNFIVKPASDSGEEVAYKIEKGSTSSSIIEGLYDNGLISNKLFAKIYVKLNVKKSLKAGEYKFNRSMSPQSIFEELQKGARDLDVVNVTFPEGYNIKQIAKTLFDKGLIANEEAFINEAQVGEFNYDFLKDIPKDRPSRLEGYLFPDTYEFKAGASEHEIIDRMLGRFQEIYETEISGKLGDRSLDELIIMASIVEREARVESERPIIAAVFYNRLKVDMQLQSCATIQYILGTNKERLLYEDLEIESPYNTYLNSGLPVGPICSPGKDSIIAALEPADVDYLYFVLKKYDGDGSHNFATNYNDFLKYKNELK